MAFLKNTRIRNKIIIIIFSVGALSAISGSMINYFYQVQQTKKQLVANTLLVATMLSEYCGLPLEFGYPDKAFEALEKLSSISSVHDGVLLNADGGIFATYHKTKLISEQVPSELKLENTFIEGNYIHVVCPVYYKGNAYGSLYLRSFIDWETILIDHLKVAISIIVVLLIVVYILSRLMHKSISQPIVDLTEKMNLVAQFKDYSVRLQEIGEDEVGDLYKGFNTMLSEITKKENDLKDTNESLRVNREKMRELLEKTPYPIVTADQNGNITFRNERFIQLFGYTAEDLFTIEEWWQRAYPDTNYREQVMAVWDSAIKNAQENDCDIEAYEYEVTCNNREKRIVEISGIILEGNVLVTFIDLTEKKKAELALIESEERYSKAFQTSPYSITISDPEEGFLVDVNNEFLKLSGYTREEVIGTRSTSLNLWPSAEMRNDFMNCLKQNGEISNKEYVLNTKSGQQITALLSAVFININKNSYCLVSLLDITFRKKAEDALLKSEEKYRTIFENIQDVFFQTNMEGIVTEISPSIKNFSGFTRDEMLNFSLYHLYLDTKENTKLHDALLINAEVRDYELMMVTRGGVVLNVSVNAQIIFDEEGNPSHIDGAIRDISERKKKDKIKEELKVATTRLSLATNSAGIGIWEWDITTEELIWSEEMHKLFGLDYKIQSPKNWRDHIYLDDYQELADKVDECIKTKRELTADFRAQWPGGEIRHVQIIGNIYQTEGDSQKLLGACWDISDRKKSEEKLLQSEATLYATINNTTFYIWSIDRHYRLLNINRPFKNFLKEEYQLNVNRGQFLDELSDKVMEFSAAWARNYLKALAGESFELAVEQNGRHFKYSLNPLIENATITGVTVFMEETTEIKEKEKALMKANAQIGELKVAALRSAMNPHFIFNTLNSIQYFILKNDSLNAVNYLSTFSKLIRSILNNSVNNKIKLYEEIEQLKNYVQLELLRFENKFDFELHIDEDLDVDNIEVSSMLIQPYIENAILHGLYSKKEKGTLKISVKEEDNSSILFSIEDNGIGREASFKHNFQRAMSHKSLGTHLTEERLNLLKKQNGATVIIEDLYSEGIASGTRVKIWVN